MSINIDMLLKIDKSKLIKPTKQIEIQRLSEILGEPFIIKCQATDINKDDLVSINDDGSVTVNDDAQMETILNGIVEPDFREQKVIEYFGATNAKRLIKKLFLPGEIDKIYTSIQEISGYNRDSVKEIKNL